MQIKFCLAFLLTCLALLPEFAVGQANAPYSRYGIGVLRPTEISSNIGLAGISAAYTNSLGINFNNPASYSDLFATTFEIGANFDGLVISGLDSTYKTGNGSLSHLAFGFPVKMNRWGLSFGLIPYSHVNYSFIERNQEPQIGEFNELFQGNGTLYQVYLGNGVKFKKFSFGLNVGYLFGRLEYSKVVALPDSAGTLNLRNISSLNARDVIYSTGIQYKSKLPLKRREETKRDNIHVIAGAFGSTSTKTRVLLTDYWERFRIENAAGFIRVRDTINGVFNEKSTIKLPYYFGTGVSFSNSIRRKSGSEWFLGTEFRYGNWSGFESPLGNDDLANRWRISMGGQIQPNFSPDEDNYLKRIHYRLGGYLGKSEIQVLGTQLNEYGITFGLGLPIRTIAKANLTLDIGSRGNNNESLLRETSYRITAAFTLNDRWFIKRKFD